MPERRASSVRLRSRWWSSKAPRTARMRDVTVAPGLDELPAMLVSFPSAFLPLSGSLTFMPIAWRDSVAAHVSHRRRRHRQRAGEPRADLRRDRRASGRTSQWDGRSGATSAELSAVPQQPAPAPAQRAASRRSGGCGAIGAVFRRARRARLGRRPDHSARRNSHRGAHRDRRTGRRRPRTTRAPPAGRDLAGQRQRQIPSHARPAPRATRSALHRDRPLPHRRSRLLSLHDHQARSVPVAQPPQRVAACPRPLLLVRNRFHAADDHPDVLSRGPAVRPRPHLSVDHRSGCACPPGRGLRPRRDHPRMGHRLLLGHRAQRFRSHPDGVVMTLLPATPGQTIGPFYGFALPVEHGADLVPPGSPGSIRVHGTVVDGAGAPVPDALLEIWQADARGAVPAAPGSLRRDGWTFTGWGRTSTDGAGQYGFTTIKPAAVQEGCAPFIAMTVFARGLLDRLFTRVYLPDERLAGDPLLASLPPSRRGTLIAVPDEHGLLFDVRLQAGPDGPAETVFLQYRVGGS